MSKRSRESALLESNGLTDMEKIRLMLWGDPVIGFLGIRGRLLRIERVGLIALAVLFTVTLTLLGHLGYSFSGNGGLLGGLLAGLFGP